MKSKKSWEQLTWEDARAFAHVMDTVEPIARLSEVDVSKAIDDAQDDDDDQFVCGCENCME